MKFVCPELLSFKGDLPLKEFCANEVEPMFKESDHIHIIGQFTRGYCEAELLFNITVSFRRISSSKT